MAYYDGKTETIEMSEGEAEALEQSIAKWERRANGENLSEGCANCALCNYHGVSEHNSMAGCASCIIARVTGETKCDNTPFRKLIGKSGREEAETEFLIGLRKYKKKAVSIGQVVRIRDYSYVDRIELSNGKRVHHNDFPDNEATRYRVVAANVQDLPASITGFTTKKMQVNNTVLQHIGKNFVVYADCDDLEVKSESTKCPTCHK